MENVINSISRTNINHSIINSSSINSQSISRSNVNGTKPRLSSIANPAFIYSVLIHIAVLIALLTVTPAIETRPTKKLVNIISAKLFYKKEEKKAVVEPKVEAIEHSETQIKSNEIAIENKTKNVKQSLNKSKIINNKNAEVKVNKAVTTSKFSALNSLQSLREKINIKADSQSGEDHYQALIDSKNYIPRSATKYNQLPEAKAKIVEVNCDKAFSQTMAFISARLGGTIKCNSFNGSQRFIDARLEKLGKAIDKK